HPSTARPRGAPPRARAHLHPGAGACTGRCRRGWPDRRRRMARRLRDPAVAPRARVEGPHVTGNVTRVVLADDQPLVRAGLRLILGTEPDIEIVAECDDGTAAVEATRAHLPELVLMDVRMPNVDGIAATAAIREHASPPPVLML